MHLSISFRELLFSGGSTIYIAFPSFQFLQACKICHQIMDSLQHLCFGAFNLLIRNYNGDEEITVTKERLTKLSRSSIFSPLLIPLFFWPLTISRISTPKLKTSDFTEKCPCIAYSGAIYPLQTNNDRIVIFVLFQLLMPLAALNLN